MVTRSQATNIVQNDISRLRRRIDALRSSPGRRNEPGTKRSIERLKQRIQLLRQQSQTGQFSKDIRTRARTKFTLKAQGRQPRSRPPPGSLTARGREFSQQVKERRAQEAREGRVLRLAPQQTSLEGVIRTGRTRTLTPGTTTEIISPPRQQVRIIQPPEQQRPQPVPPQTRLGGAPIPPTGQQTTNEIVTVTPRQAQFLDIVQPSGAGLDRLQQVITPPKQQESQEFQNFIAPAPTPQKRTEQGSGLFNFLTGLQFKTSKESDRLRTEIQLASARQEPTLGLSLKRTAVRTADITLGLGALITKPLETPEEVKRRSTELRQAIGAKSTGFFTGRETLAPGIGESLRVDPGGTIGSELVLGAGIGGAFSKLPAIKTPFRPQTKVSKVTFGRTTTTETTPGLGRKIEPVKVRQTTKFKGQAEKKFLGISLGFPESFEGTIVQRSVKDRAFRIKTRTGENFLGQAKINIKSNVFGKDLNLAGKQIAKQARTQNIISGFQTDVIRTPTRLTRKRFIFGKKKPTQEQLRQSQAFSGRQIGTGASQETIQIGLVSPGTARRVPRTRRLFTVREERQAVRPPKRFEPAEIFTSRTRQVSEVTTPFKTQISLRRRKGQVFQNVDFTGGRQRTFITVEGRASKKAFEQAFGKGGFTPTRQVPSRLRPRRLRLFQSRRGQSQLFSPLQRQKRVVDLDKLFLEAQQKVRQRRRQASLTKRFSGGLQTRQTGVSRTTRLPATRRTGNLRFGLPSGSLVTEGVQRGTVLPRFRARLDIATFLGKGALTGPRTSVFQRSGQTSVQRPISRVFQRPVQRTVQRPVQRSISRVFQRPVQRSVQRQVPRTVLRPFGTPGTTGRGGFGLPGPRPGLPVPFLPFGLRSTSKRKGQAQKLAPRFAPSLIGIFSGQRATKSDLSRTLTGFESRGIPTLPKIGSAFSGLR